MKKFLLIDSVFTLLSLYFLLFSSCSENRRNHPPFFSRQTNLLTDDNESGIMKIDTDSIIMTKDSLYGYFFKSFIYINEMLLMEGVIYEDHNCLYVNLDDVSPDVKVFDFNQTPDECDTIVYFYIIGYGYKIGDSIRKNFYLCLEDKFYDSTLLDTIFQFRLTNFGINLNFDDIIVFVGKEVGIQGYILGDKISTKSDSVVDIYYYTNGEIYKTRPYFNKLTKKRLL